LLGARGFGAAVCSTLGPRGCKWLAIGSLFDVPLTEGEMQLLLDNDLRIAEAAAVRIFPAFLGYSRNRQAALLNLLFNMGETHFGTFHDLIAAVRAGDWQRAKREALDSKWAREDVAHSRSTRVAQQLADG
jgi:lysozyme